MTETQYKFLTSYLGECWKGDIIDGICERCGTIFSTNRTFTTAQDKQDLLEAIDRDGEFIDFHRFAYENCDVENKSIQFFRWFVFLSPLETAELICRWKGGELNEILC